MICEVCGDYGMPNGCPKCGKDDAPSIDLNEFKKPEKFITRCEFKLIPHEYIGIKWDKSYLLVDHEDLEKNVSFLRFVEQCEKFHDIFANGQLVNKSIYFYAPPGFGKDVLAFSCMQFAEKCGRTVAPFLDTTDVKRLLILGAENPKYKVLGRIDYDSYLSSEVLFVTVTKTTYLKEAYTTLIELLSKRSRLGLPTYILSEYGVGDLTKDAVGYSKNKFLNASVNVNELKYPAIIGFNNLKK